MTNSTGTKSKSDSKSTLSNALGLNIKPLEESSTSTSSIPSKSIISTESTQATITTFKKAKKPSRIIPVSTRVTLDVHEKLRWLEENTGYTRAEIVSTMIEDAIDPIIEAHKQ